MAGRGQHACGAAQRYVVSSPTQEPPHGCGPSRPLSLWIGGEGAGNTSLAGWQTTYQGIPGTYLLLNGSWAQRETLAWSLPMKLQACGPWSEGKLDGASCQGDPSWESGLQSHLYTGISQIAGCARYAITYGPILLALTGAARGRLAVQPFDTHTHSIAPTHTLNHTYTLYHTHTHSITPTHTLSHLWTTWLDRAGMEHGVRQYGGGTSGRHAGCAAGVASTHRGRCASFHRALRPGRSLSAVL
jgi:hypothetical protein